ncbi:MAG: DUF924 domain-containing protein [Candidatus Omnitrophica bacterium]|nr:DUF924 domain-containing protein [Candidatus Omnitrophota bacterium]
MESFERSEEILLCWFGLLDDDAVYPEEKSRIWFNGGDEVDEYIRLHFEHDLLEAAKGKRDDWRLIPRGTLALILLFDQFPRNIYRDTPASFSFDEKALDLCLWGLEKGYDNGLRPVERVFYYLPMEHSESLEIQRKSVAYFEKLVREAPAAVKLPMDVALEYAVKHYEIIKRFGRFPHRNEILDRESTREELEFLKESDSSF